MEKQRFSRALYLDLAGKRPETMLKNVQLIIINRKPFSYIYLSQIFFKNGENAIW